MTAATPQPRCRPTSKRRSTGASHGGSVTRPRGAQTVKTQRRGPARRDAAPRQPRGGPDRVVRTCGWQVTAKVASVHRRPSAPGGEPGADGW
jgi:hypothetical protein